MLFISSSTFSDKEKRIIEGYVLKHVIIDFYGHLGPAQKAPNIILMSKKLVI